MCNWEFHFHSYVVLGSIQWNSALGGPGKHMNAEDVQNLKKMKQAWLRFHCQMGNVMDEQWKMNALSKNQIQYAKERIELVWSCNVYEREQLYKEVAIAYSRWNQCKTEAQVKADLSMLSVKVITKDKDD